MSIPEPVPAAVIPVISVLLLLGETVPLYGGRPEFQSLVLDPTSPAVCPVPWRCSATLRTEFGESLPWFLSIDYLDDKSVGVLVDRKFQLLAEGLYGLVDIFDGLINIFRP